MTDFQNIGKVKPGSLILPVTTKAIKIKILRSISVKAHA